MGLERRATTVIKSPWERHGQDDPLLRHANRRSVQMRAFIVRGDDEIVDVSVADLSYAGCAIHTETPLTKGEEVRMSVLGLKAVKATVRWYRGRKAGLYFEAAAAATALSSTLRRCSAERLDPDTKSKS
jgi:hypothetical protein